MGKPVFELNHDDRRVYDEVLMREVIVCSHCPSFSFVENHVITEAVLTQRCYNCNNLLLSPEEYRDWGLTAPNRVIRTRIAQAQLRDLHIDAIMGSGDPVLKEPDVFKYDGLGISPDPMEQPDVNYCQWVVDQHDFNNMLRAVRIDRRLREPSNGDTG